MKLAISALLLMTLAACGRADQKTSDVQDIVHPGELRGKILVLAPTDVTLPDCNISHSAYSNTKFTARSETGYTFNGTLGQSLLVPEGTYRIIMNETAVSIKVQRRQETELKAGRAEVSDVGGTWIIKGQNLTTSSYALTTLPTGCGVNLTPAVYTLRVSYQGHTVDFPVDLTD